jgi:hypothetical protein
VHLATLREDALQRLQDLDSVKVSLTEKKAVQQGRLIAALDARLSAAHAAVDPHRVTLQQHVQALERAAAYYSSVLQGVAAQPASEEWAAATQKYQQLLQEQEQQVQQLQMPAELASKLGAALQPCPVGVYKNRAKLSGLACAEWRHACLHPSMHCAAHIKDTGKIRHSNLHLMLLHAQSCHMHGSLQARCSQHH